MTSAYMPLDEEIVEHDNGYDPYNSATTRAAPPIPAWLANDPELEAIARVICGQRVRVGEVTAGRDEHGYPTLGVELLIG